WSADVESPADELTAVRLVLDRAAKSFPSDDHLQEVAGLLARFTAPAMEDERSQVLLELAFDEELAERRMADIRSVLGEHHLRVTGDRQRPVIVAEVVKPKAPDLDVILRRYAHLQAAPDAADFAGENDPVGEEGNRVLARLRRHRLLGG